MVTSVDKKKKKPAEVTVVLQVIFVAADKQSAEYEWFHSSSLFSLFQLCILNVFFLFFFEGQNLKRCDLVQKYSNSWRLVEATRDALQIYFASGSGV